MRCPLIPVNFENATVHSVTSTMVKVIFKTLDFGQQILDKLRVVMHPLIMMSETGW